MWKEFSLIYSYTIECSFCGPTNGKYKDCHFNTSMLEVRESFIFKEMGKNFCLTLIDFTTDELRRENVLRELEVMHPRMNDTSIPMKDPSDAIRDIEKNLKEARN
jgi:hypothetical protein